MLFWILAITQFFINWFGSNLNSIHVLNKLQKKSKITVKMAAQNFDRL